MIMVISIGLQNNNVIKGALIIKVFYQSIISFVHIRIAIKMFIYCLVPCKLTIASAKCQMMFNSLGHWRNQKENVLLLQLFHIFLTELLLFTFLFKNQ